MNEKRVNPWQIVLLLTVNLCLLILVCKLNAQAVRLGDSGVRVAKIQRELQRQNVYDGSINGLYDFKTKRGVDRFREMCGMEKSGEADYETLRALGLDSQSSECFTSRTELLARCIDMSGCLTYPGMLDKGIEILTETNGAVTLGRYISENFPDFADTVREPSVDAYNAALNAIKNSRS